MIQSIFAGAGISMWMIQIFLMHAIVWNCRIHKNVLIQIKVSEWDWERDQINAVSPAVSKVDNKMLHVSHQNLVWSTIKIVFREGWKWIMLVETTLFIEWIVRYEHSKVIVIFWAKCNILHWLRDVDFFQQLIFIKLSSFNVHLQCTKRLQLRFFCGCLNSFWTSLCETIAILTKELNYWNTIFTFLLARNNCE